MAFINIQGNADPILALSSSGTGPGSTVFTHDQGVEFNYPGALYPAVFELAVTDLVGPFSGLQVNLEWSPISPDMGAAQFQTVGTWLPLATPVTFLPCSSTGIYRLNCTSFVGGTSFNVYVSIAAAMPQGAGGSGGGGGVVTQGTNPWVVAFSSAQHVIVDSGAGAGVQFADATASGAHPTGTQIIGWNKAGTTVLAITAAPLTNAQALHVAIVDGTGTQITSFGGGTQFADNSASGGTPTGTLSMGWDSANSKVRALKVDASQNLLVVFGAAQHVIIDSGAATVSGSVGISGAVDVSDRIARVLGHVVVDSGSVAVSNFPATQIVAGAITPADSFANPTDAQDVFALNAGWDQTNSKWQRLQVDAGTGTLKVDPGTVTITGSVSVSNFPATYDVSDRAARLLGVVYGSQAQQLVQTPTNFNLKVELAAGATLYDARSIRALTSADVVTVAQGATPFTENLTQINGNAVVTAANGIQLVAIANGTGTGLTSNNSGAFSTALDVNITRILGNTLAGNAGLPISQDGIHIMPSGDAIARAIFHQITDGTNGPVAVKAASTAVQTTDPALVVAISPNSNGVSFASGASVNASLTSDSTSISDLLRMVLAEIKLLNLNLASCIPSAYVDQDSALIDTFQTN